MHLSHVRLYDGFFLHKVPKTSEGGVVKFLEAGSTHKCLHSEWGKTAPQPPQHIKATLACIYRMLDFMMDLSSQKVPKTSEGGVVKFSEAGSTHKCLHSEWGKTAPQPPQHVKATIACIYLMLDFMMDIFVQKVPKTSEGVTLFCSSRLVVSSIILIFCV